ncbi:MAG: hypothetical protein JNM89_10005 [Hyphomicrobiaceae bacterium]|nr:hypothetical protein [Hyphomicrobiaceae bacterium]
MYRTLNPDKIIVTLEQLERRIDDRFPGSGLSRVCAELTGVARETKTRVAEVAAPNIPLRAVSILSLITGLMLLGYVATIIEVKRDAENLYGVLQGLDSAFNIIILMGAGALFLSGLEARWKRQQALTHLHELRSIVHVVDMHQLTKDPSRISTVAVATPNSPQRALSPFELARYLDYCSEMLSLAAKVAALYAQGTKDPVVVETASDLGQITSNMSGKIWQKITLVQSQMLLSGPPPTALPVGGPGAMGIQPERGAYHSGTAPTG